MILAVLQARMGSSRLPGKSMATLQGQPMIVRQLERLRGARCLSKIIVATSQDEADDALAGFLVSRGHTVHPASTRPTRSPSVRMSTEPGHRAYLGHMRFLALTGA